MAPIEQVVAAAASNDTVVAVDASPNDQPNYSLDRSECPDQLPIDQIWGDSRMTLGPLPSS